MTPRLDVIGIVTSDMAASLAFYRRLGLDIPTDADTAPHVEAALPGGMRLAWDTEDVVRSFDPGWTPPSTGDRLGLNFLCDSPADVDAAYAELTGAGYAATSSRGTRSGASVTRSCSTRTAAASRCSPTPRRPRA